MSCVTKNLAEARRVGMNLLARREHSEVELRRKLQARDFENAIIEQAISDLVAKNFLSNTRFIESYLQARRNKGYGPIRIQVELAARGISADVIEQHVKMHDNAWFAVAHLAWKKKFKNTPPRDYKERAQHMRFLQYRGFTSEQINSTLQSDIEHA